MKKIRLVIIVFLAALGLNSCGGFGGGPEQVGSGYKLYGRWQNTQDTTNYRVYYSAKVTAEEYMQEVGDTMTNSFYWGKEWTEADGVCEEDLVEHGNGWYMWRKVSNDLMELCTMDNHGAVLDRMYTLTILNDSVLSFKTESGKKYTFAKIARQ